MTLVLEIALGYVLGRALVHLLGLLVKLATRRALELFPTYRRWVRDDVARDRRLKRDVLES